MKWLPEHNRHALEHNRRLIAIEKLGNSIVGKKAIPPSPHLLQANCLWTHYQECHSRVENSWQSIVGHHYIPLLGFIIFSCNNIIITLIQEGKGGSHYAVNVRGC